MEQNQEQKQFRCTGDCTLCLRVQREYCASQKGYDNQRILLDMQKFLKELAETVKELKSSVVSIQESGETVFVPGIKEISEIQSDEDATQDGDGEEE